jgi:hypothetical protein
MTIFFDSNSGATVRVNGAAYLVGDKINSTSTTKPFTFECTVAGTAGGSEPTWPTVAENTVVDGTVTWKAKTPDTWEYALLTAQRAIITQALLLDNTVKIYGEKNHLESESIINILASTYIYDEIPAIYRVDKTTGLYSPAFSDGSSNINFQSNPTGSILINPYSHWFGFKFSAGKDFNPRVSDTHFEDCVIEYGTGSSLSRIYLDTASLTTFFNCLIDGTFTSDSYLRVQSNAYIKFTSCTINATSTANGFVQEINNNFDFQAVEFEECDMSGLQLPALIDSSDFGSGLASGASDNHARILFKSCILPDDYTIWDGQWFANMATYAKVENCSSNGSAPYKQEYRDQAGGRSTNDVVSLNGGFFTPFGVKLTEELTPSIYTNKSIALKSSKIGVYVETAEAKIFELELLENFTVPLTNENLWVELHYYGGATDAFHTIDTSSKRYAQLTYNTLPAGAGLSGWAGEGAGYRSIKLQVAVTVARVGIAYAVVKLGKYETGKTVIINPLLTEL